MSGNSRWISTTEAGLLDQGKTLASATEAAKVALQVTNAQAAALTSASEAFQASMDVKAAAEAAYRSAVIVNNNTRELLVETMSDINKWIQAQPTVSDSTKAAAGYPVYSTPSRGAPATPSDVSAEVFGQAGVFLKWNRNGNPRSALFTIQQKVGNGPWTVAGTTNGSRLRFQVASPGTPTQFRVLASRAEVFSAPSIAVSLWAEEGDTELSIAA